MTDNGKETISPFEIQKESIDTSKGPNPVIVHEVFKNNTTAVEVIVKNVRNKSTKMTDNLHTNRDISNKELWEENEMLKKKLDEAFKNLGDTNECFKAILDETKKQLERAHQREMEEQTKNLALQLENLKLRSLLDSKTNVVKKLTKELTNMRRVIKCVAKGVCSVSRLTEFPTSNESAYREFEKELKNDFVTDSFKGDGKTFESSEFN